MDHAQRRLRRQSGGDGLFELNRDKLLAKLPELFIRPAVPDCSTKLSAGSLQISTHPSSFLSGTLSIYIARGGGYGFVGRVGRVRVVRHEPRPHVSRGPLL